MSDYKYMRQALDLANTAMKKGEVPVGAVVVCDDKVIGTGYNLRNTLGTSLAHAEIIAINKACEHLGDWRLSGCSIYVTLEPCAMCSGAIIESRIDRVVFGAFDLNSGAFDSVCNLSMFGFMHKPEITAGIMEQECTDILKNFFANLRSDKLFSGK